MADIVAQFMKLPLKSLLPPLVHSWFALAALRGEKYPEVGVPL